uniref:Uncharacterized protein n=1 Tax=Utricularia reniformis TaxID=192314 RepID=A0A1Y0B1N2_9LAMI|nr:hypothetical protein AEK19_MT1075 [Utricularia reniformis]ART31297.1 hypothetical protein AEK19_MT1075 [Utricularia reniformis]
MMSHYSDISYECQPYLSLCLERSLEPGNITSSTL